MPRYVALVAVLVSLPTLGIGTMLDDHYLRVTMLQDPAYTFVRKSPLDVFRLFDGDPIRTLRMMDRGLAVWWTDPQVRLAFFRPLTAATHLFDFKVANGASWWMHLMLYVGLLRHVSGRPTPRAITPLALGTRGLTLLRTGERSLRVRQDGGFALQPTETLTCQAGRAWSAGTHVRLSDLTVEIIDLTADGRPQTVDFIFDRALHDASLRFTEWNGYTLVPFEVPGLGKWRRIEGRDVLRALAG